MGATLRFHERSTIRPHCKLGRFRNITSASERAIDGQVNRLISSLRLIHLARRLVGWLVGCLNGWLAGWLAAGASGEGGAGHKCSADIWAARASVRAQANRRKLGAGQLAPLGRQPV